MIDEIHNWTFLDERVAAARRTRTPKWTPNCLEPDALLDLMERDESDPEAMRMLAQVAECPYCRQQYVQMRRDLLEARQFREHDRRDDRENEPHEKRLLDSAKGSIPSFVTKVSAALENRQIALPRPLLRRLNPVFAGHLQGAESAEAGFSLLSPIGICVASDRPHFRWESVSGVRHYTVSVYDRHFNLAAQSELLSETEWTAADPLARDAIYTWEVVAVLDRTGDEITLPAPPAPEVKFRVLSQGEATLLEQAIREADGSHLGLAIAYGEAGILDAAEQELEALQASYPDSDIARSLLDDLQDARRSAALAE